MIVLPPCASNLSSRLNGEVTLAAGDTKVTLGRRVIARVASAMPVAAGAGGKAASSGLIRTVPALAARASRSKARKHKAKARILAFMQMPPQCRPPPRENYTYFMRLA